MIESVLACAIDLGLRLLFIPHELVAINLESSFLGWAHFKSVCLFAKYNGLFIHIFLSLFIITSYLILCLINMESCLVELELWWIYTRLVVHWFNILDGSTACEWRLVGGRIYHCPQLRRASSWIVKRAVFILVAFETDLMILSDSFEVLISVIVILGFTLE